MAKKKVEASVVPAGAAPHSRPSALVDTRVVYCGDNLEQLKKLPDGCVDLVYIDPPRPAQPGPPLRLDIQVMKL